MSKENPVLRWPEPSDFKRSIQLEFTLYLSAAILVLMLATGLIITHQYVDTVTRAVIDKLLVQARSSSATAGKHLISSDEPDMLLLGNMCSRLAQDNPEIYWAGIANMDSIFIAHVDVKKVVTAGRMSVARLNQDHKGLRTKEVIGIRGDTILITMPITENDVVLGWMQVASSTEPISKARRSSITTVASITAVIILLGLPMTMVVLRRKLRPIGIISDSLKAVDFENFALDIPPIRNNEFGYLAESLKVMAKKLSVAQQELLDKERISRELEIAREIQANILPREYPRSNRFEFTGAYQSALEVGGDYYDFIELDDKHLAFLIADVSGKSLPGMLVMLLTRDVVVRLARTFRDPAQLLIEVNSELSMNIKRGMFVTMFYGVLNKETGHVTFASAGHNPLIRVHGGSGHTELIKTKGYPLAMLPRGPFSERIERGEIHLTENDWLIQYTDGINEALNTEGEEFGMERFLAALQPSTFLGPKELSKHTLAELKSFVGEQDQYDDITFLAIKWLEGAAKTTKDSGREVSGVNL